MPRLKSPFTPPSRAAGPAAIRPGRTRRLAALAGALTSALTSALACALLALGPARAADAPAAAGYPTVERVNFVLDCMRAHPGHHFEMVSKCSCTIDAIARELPFEDYETLSTVANALTIGGERGGALRDNEAMPPMARKLRDLVARSKRSCFINPDSAVRP